MKTKELSFEGEQCI